MNKFKKFLCSVFNCLKTVVCYFLFLFVFFVLVYGCFYFGVRGYKDGQSNLNYNLVTTHSLQPMDSLEDSYDFLTSTFTMPIGFYSSTNTNSQASQSVGFINFDVRIVTNSVSSFYSSINIHEAIGDFGDENLIHYPWIFKSSSGSGTSNIITTGTSWTNHWVSISGFNPLDETGFNRTYYLYMTSKYDAGFVADISRIRITYQSSIFTTTNGFEICFFDVNDKRFFIQLVASNDFSSYYENLVPERTIFVNQNMSSNEYYSSGYSDGYIAGDNAGQVIGYNNGYSAGQISGRADGYNQGVEDANQYTFLSLIGAVIDAPITAFTSLLNFNVFGFNMLSMLTGLLTVGIIIAIIRFIMGRS